MMIEGREECLGRQSYVIEPPDQSEHHDHEGDDANNGEEIGHVVILCAAA